MVQTVLSILQLPNWFSMQFVFFFFLGFALVITASSNSRSALHILIGDWRLQRFKMINFPILITSYPLNNEELTRVCDAFVFTHCPRLGVWGKRDRGTAHRWSLGWHLDCFKSYRTIEQTHPNASARLRFPIEWYIALNWRCLYNDVWFYQSCQSMISSAWILSLTT